MRLKKLKRGFEKLSKEKARIIAHLIGDGAHYKTKTDYVLKYEVIDEESLTQFNDDLIKIYGLIPSRETNISGKTGKKISFIRLRSKLAYEDLLRYATYSSKTWRLNKPLLDSSKPIKKEFLKALFDDEGSVIPYGKSVLIRLYSINEEGLQQIKGLLFEFDISSRIVAGFGARRNVFALIINEIQSFKKKIGFNLKRKSHKLYNPLICKKTPKIA